jgi:hypothetical protein
LRKPNYRQQKKSREDARKVRQTEKQQRRQAPDKEPGEADVAQDAVTNPAATQ